MCNMNNPWCALHSSDEPGELSHGEMVTEAATLSLVLLLLLLPPPTAQHVLRRPTYQTPVMAINGRQ